MYQGILVPTDGSELMDEVIERAVDLAGKYDASVHALYVANMGTIGTLDVDDRERIESRLEARGERAVEAVNDAAEGAGLETTTATRRGTPHQRITEYVEDHDDVDLVVMGTHGRTGLSHVLLGSVAENVLRHTTVPVLLVRVTE
ncbi:universal stress protein [Halococcus hamelinensis]|uniref:Universal stress protein uspa-like protein n=1 Tax=Halococcus hamelinensis 100A6 TaxID=1132509 RepID=M0M6I4_9EURY|nr:universal stress protein [Halococcus hamelinensis]EMA39980.1 universal stress protein uspa-like protein [Halococcus hamelinensis 100A6]